MDQLRISLFGRFEIRLGDKPLTDACNRRSQELLSYLLLHRSRPHPRETLAAVLCLNCPDSQSKKCLRQALWQLQTALEACAPGCPLLEAGQEWVQVNPQANLALDVALFEQVFEASRDVPGSRLDAGAFRATQSAARLYQGDLLEGCFQDWCLYQRERLQNMLLVMLHKLMAYCETHQEYETGLSYGERILGYDPASERAHRSLMRLHFLADDRTAALRQYERCVAALDRELGVKPSARTVALREQIRADQAPLVVPAAHPELPLAALLGHLHRLDASLEETLTQVRDDIRRVEAMLA